jgi:hypothetical protein
VARVCVCVCRRRAGFSGTIAVVLAFVAQVDVFGNLHWVRSLSLGQWRVCSAKVFPRGMQIRSDHVGAYTWRNGPQDSYDALLGIVALTPIFLLGAWAPHSALQVSGGTSMAYCRRTCSAPDARRPNRMNHTGWRQSSASSPERSLTQGVIG